MNIPYDYYRIFYYVGKYGSLTAAAKELDSNQPNITRAIKNLENMLCCQLFLRSGKGVTLTEDGKRLYEHVKIAIEQLEAGEEELKKRDELSSGELYIALTEIALHKLLIPALRRYRSEYPGIRLHVGNQNTPAALEAVRTDRAELAFVSIPEKEPKDLQVYPLARYREILVAGTEYAYLKKRDLTMEMLKKLPWIGLGRETESYAYYSELFRKNGLIFHPELGAATIDQISPMVENNLGIAFLPEFLARPKLETGKMISLEIPGWSPERVLAAVCRDRNRLPASARELLRILEN